MQLGGHANSFILSRVTGLVWFHGRSYSEYVSHFVQILEECGGYYDHD
jgi:hypothetical protein